jgi:hypothetical protein
MEQMPSFIAHKVLQAHMLQNTVIKKTQPCLKKSGIGTLLKRVPKKPARISNKT